MTYGLGAFHLEVLPGPFHIRIIVFTKNEHAMEAFALCHRCSRFDDTR
jgi:hypothetical protein